MAAACSGVKSVYWSMEHRQVSCAVCQHRLGGAGGLRRSVERRWPSPVSAKATRRPHCSGCLTRSTTPARAATFTATRSSPMSLRPMSTPFRRTSGAAVGLGTRAAGWMQRAGVESILGLRIEGSALRLDTSSGPTPVAVPPSSHTAASPPQEQPSDQASRSCPDRMAPNTSSGPTLEHPWTSHRGQRPASRALHSQVMAPFRRYAPTRRLAV